MNRKKRILWISDLVTPTGFSRVSHSIIEYLPKDEYEIYGLGVNYWGDPHNYTFPIYPAGARGDVYGFGRIQELSNLDFDMIFILNDAWIVKDYLNVIKQVYKENLPKIIVYTPVDAKGHNPSWYKDFDIVTRTIVYTEFAKRVVEEASPELPIMIIPHGVDTKNFYKLDIDKKVLKKEYFKNKVDTPEDLFIVFNGNRNQPRKKLDITMEAFKLFSDDKPQTVKLYLHAGIRDAHVDLNYFAKRLGIDDRLLVTNSALGVQTVSIEKLNIIYNLADVGLNTGLGEGWGLVNMEHAVTGAPQIVPNHSALADLYKDCGILVEPAFKWTQRDIMTIGEVVQAEDIAEALELVYNDKKLYNKLSKQSIEKFSSEDYSWKTISGKFDKVFKEVL